jgi:sn-glycerol 3-phosphate transport system ATP-binding protein/multiple sugar transport system ATP-binding protein
MNGIIFEDVCKSYNDTNVVTNLNLTIKQGERLILLGPSGCGKTTTLRMVAGLESITSGALKMGGKVVNDLAPGERNVAMVFQNYALYPHMTAWENITFGLNIQKLPTDEIKSRVKTALEILNLSGYEQRKPSELSGGQKQRVALGRALVKQAPFFLLDEPLSNLDAQLRQQARTELVKIHEIYRPTMIYVTHDQIEAMTVGQRIAIMKHGVLQQLDTPDNIYTKPANAFVASFIGIPPMNLLKCKFEEGALWIDGARVSIPIEWLPRIAQHSQLSLGIRPEHCFLTSKSSLAGTTDFIEHLGSQHCIHVRLSQGGQKVLCMVPAEQIISKGSVNLSFSWNHVSLFDSVSGNNIGYPEQLIRTQLA